MVTELEVLVRDLISKDSALPRFERARIKSVLLALGVDPDAPAGMAAYILEDKRLSDLAWHTPCSKDCRTVGRGEDRENHHSSDCPRDAVQKQLNRLQAQTQKLQTAIHKWRKQKYGD
jgi:hypothetical protein